jgi:excisionase family DNA binding protein
MHSALGFKQATGELLIGEYRGVDQVKHVSSILARPILKGREVQELLSVGRTKLHHMVRQGEIKACKIGSRRVFRASDIADYITNLPETVTRDSGGGSAPKAGAR